MTECKKFSLGGYIEKKGYVEDTLCQKRFDKVKSGTMFNIARPAFKSGSVINKMGSGVIDRMGFVKPLQPNKRKGLGNKDITRTNFIAPQIRGREVLNFERLQAQDIETGGIKIQLGDKTIEKLFKVQVDDPTDVQWIAEKDRRLAAGETLEQIKNNPPFGRPQRKVSKMTNFGQSNLALDDKIEQLHQSVIQGSADSTQQRGTLALQLADLLSDVDKVKTILLPQLQLLGKTIARLGISPNWQNYFSNLGQIINGAVFNKNKGPIVMFLLSNIPAGRTIEQPITSYNDWTGKYQPAALLQLFNLGGKKRYFNFQDRAIETPKSLAAKGFDIDDINAQIAAIIPQPIGAPGLLLGPAP